MEGWRDQSSDEDSKIYQKARKETIEQGLCRRKKKEKHGINYNYRGLAKVTMGTDPLFAYESKETDSNI